MEVMSILSIVYIAHIFHRPATVHSETHAYGGARVDTLDRPFKLIADCWHHCDENGNRTFEPPRVRQIHEEQIKFVHHWLDQWH